MENPTGPPNELELAQRIAADSEQRLAFVLDAANIGDWAWDLRTNEMRRSLRHDLCFGPMAPLPAWDYATFLARVAPADREMVDRTFTRARAAGADFKMEFRVVWEDGTYHWLWLRGRFDTDAHGESRRVAGIIMDITERKLAERAMANALDRLTEAQRIGKIGDWEWDLAANRMTWSPQVFEIMGRDPRLGTPQGVEELALYFDASSVAVQTAKTAEAIETKVPQEYELTVVRTDGTRACTPTRCPG